MSVAAGDTPSADALNDPQGSCVARGQRDSSSTTTTTTEQPVMRIDAIAMVSGRRYEYHLSPVIGNSTVAADLISIRLRYSTTGVATITSTVLVDMEMASKSAGGSQQTQGFTVGYSPTGNETVSVLLTVVRSGGTGTVGIPVSAAPAYSIRLEMLDAGVDPGDTGVDL